MDISCSAAPRDQEHARKAACKNRGATELLETYAEHGFYPAERFAWPLDLQTVHAHPAARRALAQPNQVGETMPDSVWTGCA
ncbi:hypothetical protein [Arthrobacter sp. Alg241-R88]|uniref:hypothetical protein n=1 Tax=Arthrobacter sp. Alg241-R88 TaxID=2305984 RepID=UPI0013D6EE2F|nr:hypothetical protein [Arthrobacter sp. Alg241-R88]